MEKNRYRYLFFDLDNTLFDFNEAERQAFEKVCMVYGIRFCPELFAFYHAVNDALWKSLERGEVTQKDLQTRRFEEVCRQVKKTDVCCEEMNRDYRNFLAECSVMVPGALNVVQGLSETCTICLVTNGVSKTQRKRLQGSPLMEVVSEVFISEEVGFHKPQKEFFDYVLEKTGAGRQEALVIGDSVTSDILGGKNAGIDTCLYDPLGKGYPEEIRPDFTIRKLDELFVIVSDGAGSPVPG